MRFKRRRDASAAAKAIHPLSEKSRALATAPVEREVARLSPALLLTTADAPRRRKAPRRVFRWIEQESPWGGIKNPGASPSVSDLTRVGWDPSPRPPNSSLPGRRGFKHPFRLHAPLSDCSGPRPCRLLRRGSSRGGRPEPLLQLLGRATLPATPLKRSCAPPPPDRLAAVFLFETPSAPRHFSSRSSMRVAVSRPTRLPVMRATVRATIPPVRRRPAGVSRAVGQDHVALAPWWRISASASACASRRASWRRCSHRSSFSKDEPRRGRAPRRRWIATVSRPSFSDTWPLSQFRRVARWGGPC
jgi:hypothetical protein